MGIDARAFLDTACQAGLGRLGHKVKRRLLYRFFYPLLGPILFPLALPNDGEAFPPEMQSALDERALALADSPPRTIQEAEELTSHSFRFLNQPGVCLGNPVNWHRKGLNDRLWWESLHYGEWALKLAQAYLLTGKIIFLDAVMRLCSEWMEHNSAGQEPGWEPYPLSRRLVSWTRAGAALWPEERWRAFWHVRLLPSLRQQANFLAANLERDLANNHLLANFRALAWMGLLLPKVPEAAKWRSVGLAGLEAEIRRQVLSDGMHNERSISYHVMVLRDLFEVWWLARRTGSPLPEKMKPILLLMFQFLAGTQAPDGTWPMVNDTVPGFPMDPKEILGVGATIFRKPQWTQNWNGESPAYWAWLKDPRPAEKLPQESKTTPSGFLFPQAGYGVLREGDQNYLFFDSGPMGPPGITGHGHADTLSFVLYGKGRALIIDPGVFSYHDSYWRNHFRGTAAHNTVVVDGLDQCRFWGPFRAAFAPQARFTGSGRDYLEGEHEGYCRLSDPTLHRRRIRNMGSGCWEIQDSFQGAREHSFVLSLQFSDEAVGEIGGLNAVVRWPDGVKLKIICPAPPPRATARLEPGWISSGWNVKKPAPRYVLCWEAKAPLENRLILNVEP